MNRHTTGRIAQRRVKWLTERALIAAMLLAGTRPAVAQSTSPPPVTQPSTTWSARNWTRLELWSFFEPSMGGGDHVYAYPANRLQLGLRRVARRYELAAAMQYVQFGNLPSNAVGPGPLGLGAVYFTHAGRSDSRQVYLRYLNARITELLPGVAIQVGRMPYSSGGEAALAIRRSRR